MREKGVIKSISNLSNRQQYIRRKQWKKDSRNYRKRKSLQQAKETRVGSRGSPRIQSGRKAAKHIYCSLSSGYGYTVEVDSDADSEVEESWDDDEVEEPEAPQFLDFDKSIKDAIQTLGGKVFPKLNWSSPRDASWISFSGCKCTTISDIYLLLKSSDFIIHDLTQRYMLCEDFEQSQSNNSNAEKEDFYLVLRKWTEINPSCEYRCFVRNGILIGICQREHTKYFDHIHDYKDEIIDDIVHFFQHRIRSKFSCDNYVFDVYRKEKDWVYLIDFNPFGVVTDSLLFNWDELKNGSVQPNGNSLPEFRYLESGPCLQANNLNRHPKDIVDISTGEDSFKLVDFIKLISKKIGEPKANASDDSDEEWKV
ncbi:Cell division cycle protein 123 [Araneus ventricosus]|uniref:Cell division cycle protein 123 n=1 Tax=Araneus ventricosus TaxID=182803 RepID=A0A4Y2HMI4_ARAVE|nr:Cell division cycle protein 123 [Araneus ventricosus]